jgi:hypothetical protein
MEQVVDRATGEYDIRLVGEEVEIRAAICPEHFEAFSHEFGEREKWALCIRDVENVVQGVFPSIHVL